MVRPRHVIKLKSHSSVAGDEAFRGEPQQFDKKPLKANQKLRH